MTVRPEIFYHDWEAENAAKEVAETYKPRTQMTHRHRSILKTKSGDYRVLIFGKISRAHFTVYVAENGGGEPVHEAFHNKHAAGNL